ncbi:uncharacterized protein [Littorina saxatilis]|uniref:Uncharacterized protein n=1 Tax=Littorina saxatilis TaxID=31220 RepID=A0AAN9G2Y6_9CAEN
MNSNLNTMQESYLKGLRQMTGGPQKKVVAAPSERTGLASRPKQQAPEYAHFDRRQKLSQAFDISNKAMVVSLIFWLLIMYLLYIGGGYGLMSLRVSRDDGDIHEECPAKLDANISENLHILENYPLGEAGPYIGRFPSAHASDDDFKVDATKLPPLVTGAASWQYYQLQGFIRHVHNDLKPQHPDLKLIVYDLGLSRREREILEQYCDCDVRTVDYGVYPDHVADTTNFAWRPIVLQILLEEFGSVAYADVTTRFKTSNSLNLLHFRDGRNFLMWDMPVFTSVVAYTNKLTFQYLNETRCVFKESSMIDSQLLVLYRTSWVWQRVMKPLLKCALNLDCIAPRWSHFDGCLHFRRPKTTGCHRYDLSVFSIVLNRGMQMTVAGNINRHVPPKLTYFSDDQPTLFMEQPWTYTQIMILMCIPWLVVLFMIRKPLFRCLNSTIVKNS